MNRYICWCYMPVIVCGLLLSTFTFADGKIIKWVDEKGITHYGDKIPAQDSGRKNTELNSQGVTLRQNDPSKKLINSQDSVSIEQARRDHALLASYNNESDIDVARDRNLELDEIAVQALNQRMKSVVKKLSIHQKSAEAFKSRKKPLPIELVQDLNENQSEISKVNKLIVQRKQSMQETRKRYAAEKQRYLELRFNSLH